MRAAGEEDLLKKLAATQKSESLLELFLGLGSSGRSTFEGRVCSHGMGGLVY